MSLLVIFAADDPTHARRSTRAPAEIASELGRRGVRFEQWRCGTVLPDDASEADILAGYAADIARLKDEHGYQSADTVRLRRDARDPAWDDKARAARAKFLEEHQHGEDEVRFFVEGSGMFALRLADEVALVLCERGDLLSVPAGTRHWFDMGTNPAFCAIRLFVSPDGWVARFTGDPIARHFPSYDSLREVSP